MKKNILKIFIVVLGIAFVVSCSKSFLENKPIGVLDEVILTDLNGVQGLLVGAYSLLDGNGGGVNQWQASGDNWVYGSVVGGDANKGSNAGDQGDIEPLQKYNSLANNGYPDGKWKLLYTAISRCNNTLQILAKATSVSDADRKAITAETKFLRGHYHFEAKRMWNNVPFVDENNKAKALANTADIWPLIEADFQFAFDNLPETQAQAGRANKWAAAAYLAKVKLYRKDFTGAKTIFDNVIANGKTAKGDKYGLNDLFHDNFDYSTKNSKEAVFQIQYSVNDGSVGNDNGNYGNQLNYPYGTGPVGCCGFFQPSLDLGNSYKVTAAGLPNVDTYNANPIVTDLGIESSDTTFKLDTRFLDPRIDWTIGRRGIPYLDWGIHVGKLWIRDQAFSGPYAPIKNVFKKSQKGSGSGTATSNWGSDQTNAINYNIIRFADVLLMAAECEVEVGSTTKALEYVNKVRTRAANPAGFVQNAAGNAPAANYKIANYAASDFSSKANARKLVYFERKLELAMEGHRFFDLVRWNEFQTTLQNYVKNEEKFLGWPGGIGKVTVSATSNYFAIPQSQIDQSVLTTGGKPLLIQNPGY
ncbi:MAG: RagB/SusD family nutrient uptake outer membrane protein [Sediminibacterium sp.]|nr:RagB/SusD family nutrient uptake outer membrane protein [Sediminibacterium sp.]